MNREEIELILKTASIASAGLSSMINDDKSLTKQANFSDTIGITSDYAEPILTAGLLGTAGLQLRNSIAMRKALENAWESSNQGGLLSRIMRRIHM